MTTRARLTALPDTRPDALPDAGLPARPDALPDALPRPVAPPLRRTAQVGDLTPISLDALTAAGNLQTRVDRKYVVPAGEVAHLLGALDDRAQALQAHGQRTFGYRTVYFDTPELASYLASARHRPHRFKVRTRTYRDSGLTWLEVKTTDARGRTVKTRGPAPVAGATTLSAQSVAFLTEALAGRSSDPARLVSRLRPVLTTQYRRSTLFLPVDGARATLDTDLEAHTLAGAGLRLVGQVIVETKSGRSASSLDRLLWRRGHRPMRVSKFATCMALLTPDLPASRWRRTMRRLDVVAA